jgi:hypothetical protein
MRCGRPFPSATKRGETPLPALWPDGATATDANAFVALLDAFYGGVAVVLG